MLTLFLAASRYKLYVAVALAAFKSVYGDHLPPEAPVVADAIAFAALDAPAELPEALTGERLVATMAVYAAKETDLRNRPCAGRHDRGCADGGLAGGYWQLHQPAGFSPDARAQAAAWLELVRQAVRICSSPTSALAMTLSGHCTRGLRQTAARLQLVERALQAWDEKASADAEPSEAPATSAATAAAVQPAALAPAATRAPADREGSASFPAAGAGLIADCFSRSREPNTATGPRREVPGL